MKRLNSPFLFCVFLLITWTFGCKKKETFVEPNTPIKVKQSDQSGSAAADGVIDDVNDYINNNIGGGSNARLDIGKNTRLEAYNLPCGVVSVDTSTKTSSATILYKMKYGSQTPCGYKKKSGEVSFQLIKGSKFSDIGAEFKLTFTNYTVEILSSGDIVSVNGSIYISNISGGYVWEAVTKSSTVKHRVRGTFAITYANGEVRQRKYYQLRTWSSSNGWAGLTFSVAGDTTINTVKISEIGNTLDGNYPFQTEISEDYKWSNCSSSYVGPYVLQLGHARMNVSIPAVNQAYFDVEAGYYYDYNKASSVPIKASDCTSNAYKIKIVIGTQSSTQYQLY